jgi:hypothetical protein
LVRQAVSLVTRSHDHEHNRVIERRQCGFKFGRISADRRHLAFTPGLYMTVDTTLQRVDAICPRCGQQRSFTDIIFSAKVIPKMRRRRVSAPDRKRETQIYINAGWALVLGM